MKKIFVFIVAILLSTILLTSCGSKEDCFEFSDGIITGYNDKCTKDVIIPNKINGEDVIIIGDNAFKNNKLTSVIIPNSVTSIGDYAFYDNKLTSLIIPNSVTSIGDYAFKNNQLISDKDGFVMDDNNKWILKYTGNKENLVIPSGVIGIGDSAFSNDQFTSVIIPNSVTSIGNNTFGTNLNVKIIRK